MLKRIRLRNKGNQRLIREYNIIYIYYNNIQQALDKINLFYFEIYIVNI